MGAPCLLSFVVVALARAAGSARPQTPADLDPPAPAAAESAVRRRSRRLWPVVLFKSREAALVAVARSNCGSCLPRLRPLQGRGMQVTAEYNSALYRTTSPYKCGCECPAMQGIAVRANSSNSASAV